MHHVDYDASANSGAAKAKTSRRQRALPPTLPWPCRAIPRTTLRSMRNGEFAEMLSSAAVRGQRALLFETLLTTRPMSNSIESDNANVNAAYLRAFDWVQHGDEFMCRSDKTDKETRAGNCTGWAKLSNSPPWTVVSSGSTIGTKLLANELARFPHLFNPSRRANDPPPSESQWRTWIVVGGDVPEGLLSEHGQKILASGYFSRVLIEGLQHPLHLIKGSGVAPIGLTEMYLKRIQPSFLANQAARADRLVPHKRGVFAAWGAYYSHLDQ